MKNISIHNYKSLKSIEIPNLKRVNLFTGKNNTGKSSILEAILLYITSGDIEMINTLLYQREEINQHIKENTNALKNLDILSSFFTDRKKGFAQNNAITISEDEVKKISLRFTEFYEIDIMSEDSNGNKTIIGTERILINDNNRTDNDVFYGFETKQVGYNHMTKIDKDFFNKHTLIKHHRSFINYINANGESIITPNIQLWDKITLTDKEDNVISALKIIEPNISRLSFIGNGVYRYPIVKLTNSNEKYPLKSMGDGVNRILNIILALVNSEDGILLIDEFENGLHYSVQEKLWKIIFDVSNKLNVQVFVTTHSNDTINSLATLLDKNKSLDGNLYRLERKKDKIKVNTFSKEEIIIASNQQINIR